MRKISTILILSAFTFSSCYYDSGKRVKGNGHITTDTRRVGAFNAVDQKGSFDVELVVGSKTEVQLEGEENILSEIETYVDGSTLKIRPRDNRSLRPTRSVKVIVTAPTFREVETHGSGNIISNTVLQYDDEFEASTHGSGDIKLEVIAPEVKARIHGSGNIDLRGQTRKLDLESRGSGDFNVVDLMAEEVEVEITGSGNASVYASKSLNVEVRGSGDVKYKGNPTIKTDIKGSGNLRKLD